MKFLPSDPGFHSGGHVWAVQLPGSRGGAERNAKGLQVRFDPATIECATGSRGTNYVRSILGRIEDKCCC